MSLIQVPKKATVIFAASRIQNILTLKKALEICQKLSKFCGHYKSEILKTIFLVKYAIKNLTIFL